VFVRSRPSLELLPPVFNPRIENLRSSLLDSEARWPSLGRGPRRKSHREADPWDMHGTWPDLWWS
jgi:hypothetical protein